MSDRLVRVLKYGQPRLHWNIHNEPYYRHFDVLECGHELLFTGARPAHRRCPECGPEYVPPEQEALF